MEANKKSSCTRTYLLVVILVFYSSFFSIANELTDWHGIANKKYVLRILHDAENLYISSSCAGITVIEKSTGKQQTFNRANEKSFDNSILDMVMYEGELWASGRYYGFGKLSDTGYTKFDMIEAGCLNTQWMKGILIENPNDILLGGLLAFYQFDGTNCIYTYFLNPLSPMAMVTDIKKNTKGEIFVSCSDWGADPNSLFMFSEGELKPITNPCYRINRMAVDGEVIWLASDGDGLVKYDNGTFTSYNINNSNIPDNVITDICSESEGGIWIATYSYITRFIDGTFSSYPLPESWAIEDDCFLSIDVDGDIVYAGTKKHGLVRLDDGNVTIVELIDDPDFCNVSPQGIRGSSCIDKDGHFLMASSEGLNVYNPDNGTSKILPYDDLREVCVSPINGDIWLRRANPYSCIERIGDNPLSFTSETVPFFFHEDYFNIMTFDKSGNLWVATKDGLMSYNGEIWLSYTAEDTGFPIDNIKCIAFDSNNRLWCGAFGENRIGNGLIMYDGTNWYNYNTKNSQIPSNFVGAINIDNDDVIWLNCRDEFRPESDQGGFGLTSYNGKSWITYNTENSDICSNNVYSIAVDADNRKWLATTGDKGVMSFDGEDWNLYSVDNSGLGINTVIDITVDSKRDLIWFVQYSNNGVAYAKLNTTSGNIDSVITDSEESMIGLPLTVYNLQGMMVYSCHNYQGQRIPVSPGFYIAVTPQYSCKIEVKS